MDIKSIIKEKGYTIQDVAKKMGVNRVTLTLTLQGNPTYKKLKEIADAIDCDIIDFFRDETKNPSTLQVTGEGELTALIQHKGDFYKANTIEELKKIVAEIEEKSY
jgi:transcriptional regulator with XRE-family HTH domain